MQCNPYMICKSMTLCYSRQIYEWASDDLVVFNATIALAFIGRRNFTLSLSFEAELKFTAFFFLDFWFTKKGNNKKKQYSNSWLQLRLNVFYLLHTSLLHMAFVQTANRWQILHRCFGCLWRSVVCWNSKISKCLNASNRNAFQLATISKRKWFRKQIKRAKN